MTVPLDTGLALLAVLRANAALVALLGTHGGQAAIYHDRLPEGAALPALIYSQIASVPVSAMGSDPGLGSPTFQITVMCSRTSTASADKLAKQVARALKQAIVRYSGTVAVEGGNVVIQDVMQLNERDDEWPDLDRAGVHLDVLMWAA